MILAALTTAVTTTLEQLTPPTATAATDADAEAEAEAGYVPFSVSPVSGEVAAGAAAEILVKFSPLDVSEYFACLCARYRSTTCLRVFCIC